VEKTVLIFGDVHGEAERLHALIYSARERYGELEIYGVGDYIDRGPDPKGVVQICIDEGVQGILGNHEVWFRELINGKFDRGALHPQMGGRTTLDSYGLGIRFPTRNVKRCIPKAHQEWIKALPLARKVEAGERTYWLTHAGVPGDLGAGLRVQAETTFAQRPGLPEVSDGLLVQMLVNGASHVLLWQHMNPKDPNRHAFQDGAIQVFGHTPLAAPINGGHFIALDTGAGRKREPNSLTGLVLTPDGSQAFLSVKANPESK
jgi:serine/threonine protein phosphatase 1